MVNRRIQLLKSIKPKKGKILVLDDDESFCEMIQQILVDAGYQAETENSPKQALERIQKTRYALLISDYKMPEMDGDAVVKKVEDIAPQLPIILISGLMNSKDLLKVANIGISQIIEKPFEAKHLINSVSKFVSKPLETTTSSLTKKISPIKPKVGNAEPRPFSSLITENSQAMQRFLESLWLALPERHLLMMAPDGSEVDLLCREINIWIDNQDLLSARISADELSEIGNIEKSIKAPVILVDCSHLDTKSTLDKINQFQHARNEELTGPESKAFIYLLPEEAATARSLVKNYSLIQFPPLQNRQIDMAKIIDSILELKEQKYSFTQDAIAVLLHYNWPGNYRELKAVCKSIKLYNKENEIDAPMLLEAIRHRHGDLNPQSALSGIEAFLAERQSQMLAKLKITDIKEYLKSKGARMDLYQNDLPINAQPLLFPEVL